MAPETPECPLPDELIWPLTYDLFKEKEEDPFAILGAYVPPKAPPKRPAEWFIRKFPEEAKKYGCPFLEARIRRPGNGGGAGDYIKCVSMNEEFFAAILGGRKDMGHHVIYYLPEAQFYFKDPVDGLFRTTSEEKLQSLLGLYLIRCAQEMAPGVDKFNLFVKFRDPDQLKLVVKKARSILGADDSFFSLKSPHRRIEGPETHGKIIKLFVETSLESNAEKNMTITQVYGAFKLFCEKRGVPVIKRQHFRALIIEIINDEWELSLRHDVLNESGRQQNGWAGLGLKDDPGEI